MKSFLTVRTFLVAAFTMCMLPIVAQNDEDRPSQALITDGKFDIPENPQERATFANYPAAITALPAMPSIGDITSKQAKTDYDGKTMLPWHNAYTKMVVARTDDMVSNGMKLSKAQEKAAAEQEKNIEAIKSDVRRVEKAGLMPTEQELMQAIQSSGTDLEDLNEKKMMDIMAGLCAKKWGLPKEECLKIMSMSMNNPKKVEEYMKTNHPELYQRMMAVAPKGQKGSSADPRDAEFNEVNTALENAQSQVSDLSTGLMQGSFGKMYEQLPKEWAASAEAKQVDALERALQQRLNDWMAANVGQNGEVAYPDWFTTERKKVNAIIDKWNHRNAERWLGILLDYHSKVKMNIDKVVLLDSKNEQINSKGTPDTLPYLTNRHIVLTVYGMMDSLVQAYAYALAFPCVERLPETGSTWFGKG